VSRIPFAGGEPEEEGAVEAAANIALARQLLVVPDPPPSSGDSDGTENPHEDSEWNACPCCGGRMIIIETFEPGCQPRLWPIPSIGLDSS
jgi:hypothetical protein